MAKKITAEAIRATITRLEREGTMPKYVAIVPFKRGAKTFYTLQAKPQAVMKSLYLGDESSAKYQEWNTRHERSRAVRVLKAALKIVGTDPQGCQQMLADLSLVNKMGDTNASVEWYTPPEFIELARVVLGAIDLDPASNPVAQEWIKASRFYTEEEDGLMQPWSGRVWCNPPYGEFPVKFLSKGLEAFKSGAIDSAIFLLNRTGAAWYTELADECSVICQAKKRISFLDTKLVPQTSPRYYNDFLYLGKAGELFTKTFAPIGRIVGG